MADKRNKGKDEGEERETKSFSEPPNAGKSGLSMIIPLMIACVLIGLAGVGAGGYFLFTNMQSASASEEEASEEASEEPTETDIYFDKFPESIVNLGVSEDSPFTYLKYAFSVEVSAEEVVKELEVRLPRLTSTVATVMSNRSWTEISTEGGRKALAEEAITAINKELAEGKVIGLYFTTFVAQ